jgi:hypothetical protein
VRRVALLRIWQIGLVLVVASPLLLAVVIVFMAGSGTGAKHRPTTPEPVTVRKMTHAEVRKLTHAEVSDAARMQLKARSIRDEMLRLVQRGRAMQPLRVRMHADFGSTASIAAQKKCLELMYSYLEQVDLLATQAKEIPSAYNRSGWAVNPLVAVSGTIGNCVVCSDSENRYCDIAESFLKESSHVNWLLSDWRLSDK